jgi:hypothetical protein
MFSCWSALTSGPSWYIDPPPMISKVLAVAVGSIAKLLREGDLELSTGLLVEIGQPVAVGERAVDQGDDVLAPSRGSRSRARCR